MDRLEHIFEMQKMLDNKIIRERNLENISCDEWILKECLALVSEVSELMNEVNFKWWKNPKPIDRHRVHEELIDILHFFVSMCIKANLDPDQLYKSYLAKNIVNVNRQDGNTSDPGYSIKP